MSVKGIVCVCYCGTPNKTSFIPSRPPICKYRPALHRNQLPANLLVGGLGHPQVEGATSLFSSSLSFPKTSKWVSRPKQTADLSGHQDAVAHAHQPPTPAPPPLPWNIYSAGTRARLLVFILLTCG